ncbi:MAG: hypothetical protein POH28_07290 [Acidocella sp.]|nr:hypothetical protein [Acidocella sp.]
MSTSLSLQAYDFEQVVDEIYHLNWEGLSEDEMVSAAWAYYYFSIQFRESLKLAVAFRPDDANLRKLDAEECDTANLSPYPGVAAPDERMNHDEFMRRVLTLTPIDTASRAQLEALGDIYLTKTRNADDMARALSIASYEDGGLERVFKGMLKAPDYDHPLLAAFRFFLTEHIRFDSDADAGHGALARHMRPDDRVLPLWTAFKDVLVSSAPGLLIRKG